MSDRELADRVVALGVGLRNPDEKDWFVYGIPSLFPATTAKHFVRDPRVAMALMERMIAGELTIWRQAYDNDSPVWIVETHLTNADGRDESLPRAIIEACVEALEDKT